MKTVQDFEELIAAWNSREPGSAERLFSCFYAQLRHMAAGHLLREDPGHTLQSTALANEAYLRLSGGGPLVTNDQEHFCAIASRTMRQILIDHARRRQSAKRGGGLADSPLDSFVLSVADSVDLVELDIALDKLGELDPREASVVELRFFGGLTVPEVANALGISVATAERDWVTARAWLRRELSAPEGQVD